MLKIVSVQSLQKIASLVQGYVQWKYDIGEK